MFGLELDTIAQLFLLGISMVSTATAWVFNKLRRQSREDLERVVQKLRISIRDQFSVFIRALKGLKGSSLGTQKEVLLESLDLREALQPMLVALSANDGSLETRINRFFSALAKFSTQRRKIHSENTRKEYDAICSEAAELFSSVFGSEAFEDAGLLSEEEAVSILSGKATLNDGSIPCPACNGTGRRGNGRTCTVCGGSGRT